MVVGELSMLARERVGDKGGCAIGDLAGSIAGSIVASMLLLPDGLYGGARRLLRAVMP